MFGFLGASYGEEIPVKKETSPFLALLYNPFGSLFSHSSKEALINTSIKLSSPMICFAKTLSSSKGEKGRGQGEKLSVQVLKEPRNLSPWNKA